MTVVRVGTPVGMIDAMTEVRLSGTAHAGAEAGAAGSARLRSTPVLLNLAGVVLVGFSLVPSRITPSTGALIALGALALACWTTWALVAPGRVRDVALVLGGITAAIGAATVSGPLIAPVISGLIVAISDPARTSRALGAYAGAVGAALAIAASANGLTVDALVSLLAGFALGVLGGVARRQRRVADLQQQRLVAASLIAAREAARAQLLEARSAAARDVHDVLAHSLGGLVIQLDAIEALLERGRIDEATTRASAARVLAGEGLEEARRAVAALRDPEAVRPAAVPDDALVELVAAHRSLGGDLRVEGELSLHGSDLAHRAAISAALREALVNARRHAPGATVRLRASRRPRAMVLRVENAMPSVAIASGGGRHGLIGMQERFAALGDGSTASAGPDGASFVVEIVSVLP